MNRWDYSREEQKERAAAYRDLCKTMRPLRYYLWLRVAKEAGPYLKTALQRIAVLIGVTIGVVSCLLSKSHSGNGAAKPPQEVVSHESR